MSDEPIFFNKLITKSLKAVDTKRRIFEGFLTVEMVDKHGEITVRDELLKVLPIWMARGAPINDYHSNRVVGKGLNFGPAVIKDEKGVELPAIKIQGEIFNDYTLDNDIWNWITTGKYTGLSFGGATKSGRIPIQQADGKIAYKLHDLEQYEVSVCPRPAVPLALITEYNTVAKAIAGESKDLDDNKMLITCTNFGCIVNKSSDKEEEDIEKSLPLVGQVKPNPIISPEDNDEDASDRRGVEKFFQSSSAGARGTGISGANGSNGVNNSIDSYEDKQAEGLKEKPEDDYPKIEAKRKENEKEDSKLTNNKKKGFMDNMEYEPVYNQDPPVKSTRQISEEEDKKDKEITKFINIDYKGKGNNMTNETEITKAEQAENVEKSVDEKYKAKISELENKLKSLEEEKREATYKATIEALEAKIKAMQTPTDLPLTPKGSAGGESVGAKVKVPDVYQSNSVQAGIRDADPENSPHSDKPSLSMQEKADVKKSETEQVTKTETPRPSNVESPTPVSAQGNVANEILKSARGGEELSSIASRILKGDFGGEETW